MTGNVVAARRLCHRPAIGPGLAASAGPIIAFICGVLTRADRPRLARAPCMRYPGLASLLVEIFFLSLRRRLVARLGFPDLPLVLGLSFVAALQKLQLSPGSATAPTTR